MIDEPLMFEAFAAGIVAPMGFWGVWLMVRAVRRGLYVGGIRGGSE